MKTIILTLATALFLGNTDVNAGSKSPVYQKINNSISYPSNVDRSIQKDFAIVEFTINKEGEVQILESNASNKDIIQHVKKELSQIKFDSNQYKIGEKYIYRFSFSS